MARRTKMLIGVTTYLTAEEYAEARASAGRAGLSLSKFLRLVSRGQPVKSLEYERERMELRRLKGEMGSIGGLLKQAIANGADKAQVGLVLRSLDKCQFEIQALVKRMHP